MKTRVARSLLATIIVGVAWGLAASPASAGTGQTISFTSAPSVSPELVSNPAYLPQATATSTLPVTLSIDASSGTSCSLDNGTGVVSFTAAGTCVIDANQPGDGTFDPAPQAQQTIVVQKRPNTITFPPPPISPEAPGANWQLQATSTAFGVQYSVDATSQGCSIDNQLGVVHFTAAGTCVVDANDPGNATFAPAAQVQQAVVVAGAANMIHVFQQPPTPGLVGHGFVLQAGSTEDPSGSNLIYSADVTSTGCTVSGVSVTYTQPGLCVVDINDPGFGGFDAAPQVQVTIPIVKNPQAIFLSSQPPTPAIAQVSGYTITGVASSTLPVTFSVDATSTGCLVSGNTVFFSSAGVCVVDANQPGDPMFAPAPQVQQTIVVIGKPQTITFQTTPSQPATSGDFYVPTAISDSTLPVTITLDGTSTGCTLTLGQVHYTSPGTCVIDADQAGNGAFAPAAEVQQTVTVVGQPQTISFTTTPTQPAPVGSQYTPAATATSSLPVTFTLDLTSTGCSLTGGVVTFTSAGVCTIDANQAGNALYAPATLVQQQVQVVASPNIVTFTSTPSVVPEVVGNQYTPTATATSNLPVTLSLDATSAGCSFTGGVVTFTAPGTCVLDANQGGNQFYAPAAQVQQSIAVGKATQAITFTSTPPSPSAATGTVYTVTATASSGLPVTFTADATSSGCAVNGAAVTFLSVGACVIDAHQGGNATYLAAPVVQQVIAIRQTQAITFTTTAPISPAVGQTYTPIASATSGLPVALSLDATSAGCTYVGGLLTFTGTGVCVLDANQNGNSQWAPAPQVQQVMAVGIGTQTIQFTSTPPATPTVGGTYHVTATATSGLTVKFTRDLGSTGCSITGATVTFTAVGFCIIDANQSGNAIWAAAPQMQQAFPVGQGSQTLQFTSSPPAAPLVGGNYTPTATSSAGLPVTITVDASGPACSIAGGIVSFNTTGLCVLDADQPGNANFAPATRVQQSFLIKGPQTIQFTSTAPTDPAIGSTYTPTAVATSGLPVTFTVTGTSPACTRSGSTFTFTRGGTCLINANQAGNSIWLAAPPVHQQITVRSPQSIGFAAAPNPGLVGNTYRVTVIATSRLPVTLTRDGASTGCTLSGIVVTFTAAGTCILDANQSGNATWAPALQVQQSITVRKPQTITFTTAPPSPAHVGGMYTPAPVSTSGLTVILTLHSGSVGCTISGGVVHFVHTGACVVLANQAGNSTFAPATQVVQSFTVRT